MPYVIKAAISNPRAKLFRFDSQKTMYRGKAIRENDEIFLFSSENEGGQGLIARGVVISVTQPPVESRQAKTRSTPRVSITIRRTACAKRSLGRNELKPFLNWDDGKPETELSFKLYRQATNKIVGIAEETASFIRSFF